LLDGDSLSIGCETACLVATFRTIWWWDWNRNYAVVWSCFINDVCWTWARRRSCWFIVSSTLGTQLFVLELSSGSADFSDTVSGRIAAGHAGPDGGLCSELSSMSSNSSGNTRLWMEQYSAHCQLPILMTLFFYIHCKLKKKLSEHNTPVLLMVISDL
jgi:hypothetical protein